MLESTELLVTVSTPLLNRQLNRVWTLLFLREICLHTTSNFGCYALLRLLSTPNQLTAMFYVMPHFSTPLRRVDFLWSRH